MTTEVQNDKERALKLVREAYKTMQDAGIAEEFSELVMMIAQANRGTFFGSFGSDTGCFVEFRETPNELTPVKLVFGVRRYKQSLGARIKLIIKESWAIFRGHDTEHSIELCADDIRKLKDLLRVLK